MHKNIRSFSISLVSPQLVCLPSTSRGLAQAYSLHCLSVHVHGGTS